MQRPTNSDDFTKQLDWVSSKVEKQQHDVAEIEARIRLIEQQLQIAKWFAVTLLGAVIVAVVRILIG